ncbi:hypothetical protein D3C87_517910 [compost metagenome]
MTSLKSGLPADPLEVNFRYGLRHKTNGRQYRLGAGWIVAAGDVFEDEKSMNRLYESHMGVKAFRELLEVSQIVTYRISTNLVAEQTVSAKLKAELDRKLEAEHIFNYDAPEHIKTEYYQYHTRAKKSTYSCALHFKRKGTQKWLNSKKDAFKMEWFGYTWISADPYEMPSVLKGAARYHGFKWPQIRISGDCILFRSKADAMVFRLALEMPATFYDFEAIHMNYQATQKIDIVSS